MTSSKVQWERTSLRSRFKERSTGISPCLQCAFPTIRCRQQSHGGVFKCDLWNSFQRWSSSKAPATAVPLRPRKEGTKLNEALIWSLQFGIYSENIVPKLQTALMYGLKRPWVFPHRAQGCITQAELESIDFLPAEGSSSFFFFFLLLLLLPLRHSTDSCFPTVRMTPHLLEIYKPLRENAHLVIRGWPGCGLENLWDIYGGAHMKASQVGAALSRSKRQQAASAPALSRRSSHVAAMATGAQTPALLRN